MNIIFENFVMVKKCIEDKYDKEIYLLTIYDKAELDTIDDKTLRRIITSVKLR